MNGSETGARRAALLSVSDKRGVGALGRALADAGFELLSTGGTAAALRDAGLVVTEVAEHTGAPEMMGGRVKTLHPAIHGGILGRRGIDDAVMAERGIVPIDVVVVNLYPFEATIARGDASFDEVIEQIDIGGPAMVRSAAKNHASVAIVTDPDDYDRVAASFESDEEARAALRFELAVKAFEHTARYDTAIAAHLGSSGAPDAGPVPFPCTLVTRLERIDVLRYGENPHQAAAFYRWPSSAAASAGTGAEPDGEPGAEPGARDGTLARSRVRQGKALSYNNVMDADAALECVRGFESLACTIVKHANPCGVGIGTSALQAYEKAWATDPTSAFGGIIAFNRPLDGDCAREIVARQFVEVVIAPAFSEEALAALATKPNVRVLEVGALDDVRARAGARQWRAVSGGVLVQDEDVLEVGAADFRTVTRRSPTADELADLAFVWRVAKFVKSNAIVYGRDGATIGVGAGQMSRVYSARIAAIKAADADLEVAGCAMASDAFFPFRDGIDNAAGAGVRAVIQPGGSNNDGEVIAAADEHDLAMVFTGVRHFRH